MSHTMNVIQTFLLIFSSSVVAVSSSAVCSGQDTCRRCISTSPECSWCAEDGYGYSRCEEVEKLAAHGCRSEFMEYPASEVRIVLDANLSETKVASEEEAVQIRPQKMEGKLRRKSPVKLKLVYKQAVDYPVDLYYLMDLSRTMLSHKKTLATLGTKLAEEMKLITANFRLGFGSFVDKTMLPFTDTNLRKLAVPCIDCAPVYGYRNHMSLSTNTSAFTREVERSPISGNLDGPEGGFDAVMQAIVCREEIGWRKDARHLLIFTSDASFHFAGDGRLAGLLEPNDQKCHLDGQGVYTEANKQDYPSIGQINAVSQENNVHIIFAIAGDKIQSYQRLVKRIKSSSLAQLTRDSSNIVNIIKGEYEKLTSNLQLSENSSDHLRVTFFSSCLGEEKKETNICHDLQVSDEVEFEIVVELLSCPADSRYHRETVKINPIGLEEGLILEVDMICSCDCENGNWSEVGSSKCSEKGTFECGICRCDSEAYGEKCECSSEDMSSMRNEEKCFPVGENSTVPCFGRGHCICGQCSCFQAKGHRYSGPLCECDDMNCKLFDGKLCGGPERGKCKCGTCECSPNYSGLDCGCPTDLRPCMDPLSQKLCNDRGKCACGVCHCNGTDYSGPYCDQCPTCTEQCPLLSPIVENQILSKEKVVSGPNYVSSLVDVLKIDPGDKICRFVGKEDCVYAFKYRDSRKRGQISLSQTVLIVEADRKRQCKEPIDIAVYSARYIAGFVVIGLFTIILWRFITLMIDRHEYQKFIKSCKNINFPEHQNPLFKPSTSTFMNPSYPN